MSPFFGMLAVFGVLHVNALRRVPGSATPTDKAALALGLSLVAAGAAHLVRPDLVRPLVPAFLPHPDAIVFVSGLVMLAVAVGLLVPRSRRMAGWAATGLFVAIWPGSIALAIGGEYPAPFPQSPLYHWARIPFHALYVVWALWVARGR